MPNSISSFLELKNSRGAASTAIHCNVRIALPIISLVDLLIPNSTTFFNPRHATALFSRFITWIRDLALFTDAIPSRYETLDGSLNVPSIPSEMGKMPQTVHLCHASRQCLRFLLGGRDCLSFETSLNTSFTEKQPQVFLCQHLFYQSILFGRCANRFPMMKLPSSEKMKGAFILSSSLPSQFRFLLLICSPFH